MVCMKTDVHSEKDANETKSKCVRLISNFLAGLKLFFDFSTSDITMSRRFRRWFFNAFLQFGWDFTIFCQIWFEGYFENACQAYGQPAPPAPSMEAVD